MTTALTDTGASILVIYYKDLINIQKEICRYIDKAFASFDPKPSCQDAGYGYVTIQGCSKKVQSGLPVINVQIDSYLYGIRPAVYTRLYATKFLLIDEWDTGDNSTSLDLCTFNMYGTNKKEWVLGSPFLNDFYQVYDLDRNQVGLVPSAYVNTDSVNML